MQIHALVCEESYWHMRIKTKEKQIVIEFLWLKVLEQGHYRRPERLQSDLRPWYCSMSCMIYM